MKQILTIMALAGAMTAQAVPSLDLVKTGTTTQNSDTITLGTSSYNLDVRFDSGGHPVSTLQYWFYTDPANAVTFGTTPVTVLRNPLVDADLSDPWPAAGDTLKKDKSWSYWIHSSGQYTSFVGNIATYQINTSLLTAGAYVFSFGHTPGSDDEYLGWSGGDLYVNDFAPPGSFTLAIASMPEPSTWTLMACGGFLAAGRNRRRIYRS